MKKSNYWRNLRILKGITKDLIPYYIGIDPFSLYMITVMCIF